MPENTSHFVTRAGQDVILPEAESTGSDEPLGAAGFVVAGVDAGGAGGDVGSDRTAEGFGECASTSPSVPSPGTEGAAGTGPTSRDGEAFFDTAASVVERRLSRIEELAGGEPRRPGQRRGVGR